MRSTLSIAPINRTWSTLRECRVLLPRMRRGCRSTRSSGSALSEFPSHAGLATSAVVGTNSRWGRQIRRHQRRSNCRESHSSSAQQRRIGECADSVHVGTAPGDYQSTPPNFPKQPQFTHWSHVMALCTGTRESVPSRPASRPPQRAYTDVFDELKSLGIAGSTIATSDQALTGRFWNGAIQNYWNEIAQTAAVKHNLTTAQNARLFALLNLTMADGRNRPSTTQNTPILLAAGNCRSRSRHRWEPQDTS